MAFAKRIIENGNEEEKAALEERNTPQESAHETDSKEQGAGKSLGKTRGTFLSKSGGQHECGEKATKRKIAQEALIRTAHAEGRASVRSFTAKATHRGQSGSSLLQKPGEDSFSPARMKENSPI
jgi:hypothetical protein